MNFKIDFIPCLWEGQGEPWQQGHTPVSLGTQTLPAGLEGQSQAGQSVTKLSPAPSSDPAHPCAPGLRDIILPSPPSKERAVQGQLQ